MSTSTTLLEANTLRISDFSSSRRWEWAANFRSLLSSASLANLKLAISSWSTDRGCFAAFSSSIFRSAAASFIWKSVSALDPASLWDFSSRTFFSEASSLRLYSSKSIWSCLHCLIFCFVILHFSSFWIRSSFKDICWERLSIVALKECVSAALLDEAFTEWASCLEISFSSSRRFRFSAWRLVAFAMSIVSFKDSISCFLLRSSFLVHSSSCSAFRRWSSACRLPRDISSNSEWSFLRSALKFWISDSFSLSSLRVVRCNLVFSVSKAVVFVSHWRTSSKLCARSSCRSLIISLAA